MNMLFLCCFDVGGWVGVLFLLKETCFHFSRITVRPKKIQSFETCFTFICRFTFKFLVRQPQVPLKYEEQVCKYGKPEFEKCLSLSPVASIPMTSDT